MSQNKYDATEILQNRNIFVFFFQICDTLCEDQPKKKLKKKRKKIFLREQKKKKKFLEKEIKIPGKRKKKKKRETVLEKLNTR